MKLFPLGSSSSMWKGKLSPFLYLLSWPMKASILAAVSGSWILYSYHRISWNPYSSFFLVQGQVINGVSEESFNGVQVSFSFSSWDFEIEFWDSKNTVLRLDDISIEILKRSLVITEIIYSFTSGVVQVKVRCTPWSLSLPAGWSSLFL